MPKNRNIWHTLCFLLAGLAGFSGYAQGFEDALAYQNPVNPDKATAPKHAPDGHAGDVTSKDDVIISSYFTLAGKRIVPYLMVDNNQYQFEPAVLEHNNRVSITFHNDRIEMKEGDKTYQLNIQSIEQLANKTPNCLVSAKIEVHIKPERINGEKINTVDVFIDHENHISFIRVGHSEFYLKP